LTWLTSLTADIVDFIDECDGGLKAIF